MKLVRWTSDTAEHALHELTIDIVGVTNVGNGVVDISAIDEGRAPG